MKANEAQESQDWMQARCGMFTASRASDLMAKTKSGPSASRGNLLALLAVERLTGQPVETYQNDAMRRGTELEAEARDAYSFATGNAVTETGFVRHDTLPNTGCSPDGIVGDDGLVEIKCPNTATHIETLLSGEIADRYVKQMQWQMACTGRAWADFVSFDPRLPGDLQLFIKRVPRDDALIAEIEDAVRFFILETEAKLRKIENLRVAA